MSIFVRKEFYNKVLSFFVTLVFLIESTLLPVITFLPRIASAQTQSVTISRTPVTSATNPFKVGDATTFTSINPLWLFASDYTGTGYNQIGSNPPRTFTFSTRNLVTSGVCNTTTGVCTIPGNWDASSFVCPASVTGVQQMKEWYTVAGLTSNTLTWYFQCSTTAPPSNNTPIGSLDGIQDDGTAWGWALDPDAGSVSISVHFYIDGAAGQGGIFAGSAVANLSRPDLLANVGYPGDHGFNFSIPQQWRDGKTHMLYVHGIDLSGVGSKNVLLSNVPKSFMLGAAKPSLSLSSYNFTQGSQLTVNVFNAAPNASVSTFCIDPNGVQCQDTNAGMTDGSGRFSKTYDTTGWTIGNYSGWVTVGGVRSNTVNYAVTAPPVSNNPSLSFNTISIIQGGSFTGAVTGAAPNTQIRIFSKGPDGVSSEDTPGTTDSSGQFSRTYTTTGWTIGNYSGWVTVGGVRSNTVSYVVTQSSVPALSWFPVSSGGSLTRRFQFVSPTKIYGIGLDNKIWRWNGGASWTQITTTGDIKDDFVIVNGSESDIYALGLDNQIWHWNGSAWSQASSGGQLKTRLQYTNPDLIYGIGLDDQIWKWTGGSNWSLVAPGGQAKEFFLRAANDIYIYGIDNQIWHWNGSAWSRLSSGGQLIKRLFFVAPDKIYGIGLDNAIWRWNGGESWTRVTNSSVQSDFVLVNNSESDIYAFGLDNQILHWGPAIVPNNSVLSVSPTTFATGTPFVVSVSGAAPNATLKTGCRDPNGAVCDDPTSYVTDGSGTWTHTYDTTGWIVGTYQGWVTVNGAQSNVANFIITAATSTPPITGRPAPTPTTAPMATLTLQRDQEQVLPNQQISFSGTLDATQVAFPQGSMLFMAISDGVAVNHIEIDGKTLASSEFSASGNSIKIPFSSALYNGSHSFRLVLQNSLPVQLDRRITVWVSVINASSKLLLKGRTASALIAHLPTEVIGKGTAVSLSRQVTYTSTRDYGPAFRALDGFSGDFDVTRGPFFTPNSIFASVPISTSLDTIPAELSENIAFTLFPKDGSMQRIGMTINQFSDPLAREFITAQYQYLLGRDPTSAEMSQYLPAFTQWRNPYAALREVYNRRADVRQAILVDKLKIADGGSPYYSAGPVSSYDKLLEWATTQGWNEEPSLASFKPQTGFGDDSWKLFDDLWNKWAGVQGYHTDNPSGDPHFSHTDPAANVWEGGGAFEPDSFNFLNATCGGSFGPRQIGPSSESDSARNAIDKPDFATCWKNPYKRNQMILWAKDVGWAYNAVVQNQSGWYGGGDNNNGSYETIRNLVEINPSGPVLASVFGPGKYPEFAAEQQLRYPPAMLYYNLISSPEYGSYPEQRFRKNIDSIYRLFLGQPASESNIAWAKNQFLNGGGEWFPPFNPTTASWINPQWEPNGQLIASNFQYVDAVEFLKNPRYITDDVYGIRHIPGEIDAVSSRLVELLEKNATPELRQGDNFKRVLSGLYRLYLRRTPTDAEVEDWRASGKNFGDIELGINQSAEYGKNPASLNAIRNLYRNYLGKDPSDAEIGTYSGQTISTIANKIGTSAEMKSLAQAHPENAYIFPIKRIKIVKCGFFCSVFGKIISVALTIIPNPITIPLGIAWTTAGGGIINSFSGDSVARINSIVLNSISKGFNEAGFDGDTFVENVSIARAMAGQAGGVFSMTNLFENADPTILDGFRTMAVVPQTPQGSAFAQTGQSPYFGLASSLGAIAELFSPNKTASTGRIAQIDVSSHYGSSGVVPVSRASTPTKGKSSAKSSTGAVKVTAPVSFTKTLAQGSRGAEVLKLQKFLGGTDLTFLPEYRTGYYGAKTVAAVKRFQKRYGLEQTGSIGPKTRALLNSTER